MSLLRTWYLHKEFSKIHERLISEEDKLQEKDADKKIELYDEAFFEAREIFIDKIMLNFWLIACAVIKYIICFSLLTYFIMQNIHNSAFAILFSAISVIFYVKHDFSELHNKFTDSIIQYLINKGRLLNDELQNMKKNLREQ
jgi:hypothetical protein